MPKRSGPAVRLLVVAALLPMAGGCGPVGGAVAMTAVIAAGNVAAALVVRDLVGHVESAKLDADGKHLELRLVKDGRRRTHTVALTPEQAKAVREQSVIKIEYADGSRATAKVGR